MYPFHLRTGTPGSLTDTNPTGRPAVRLPAPRSDGKPHLVLFVGYPAMTKGDIVQVPL